MTTRSLALPAIAVLVALFTNCARAQVCPQATLISQYSRNGPAKPMIVVGPAEFANAPRWTPGDGSPPLSAEAAVKAALAAMSKAGADKTLRLEFVNLIRVPCDELNGHWFYELTFVPPQAKNKFEAAQVVAVMLDGTTHGPVARFDNSTNAANPVPPKVAPPKITLGFDPLVPPIMYEGDSAAHWTVQPAYLLFIDGDFAQLNAELDRLRDSGELLRDGRTHYGAVMQGLAPAIGGREDWVERMETWRKQFPKSEHAVITEAEAWREYAWRARGTGFANSVSAKAMELYRERLARARRVLEESKTFAAASPYWYTSMLGIATGEGWPIAKQREVFNEGISRHPRAAGIYTAMAFRMTPRWGGDIKSYREFTELAVKNTAPYYGKSMYAWMYLQYADIENDRPFSDLGIPWPKLKSGLEELYSKYPGTWSLNTYAYFACQANDKAAFLALLPKLTKESLRDDVWFGSYTFENCKETFTKRT